ncbi:PREDICTED: 60S ribosomal protein L13-2-like [Fragaria vesca subsp. vesca]
MVKHNNVIPGEHFRKHWQNYVKTWFNQPARKTAGDSAAEELANATQLQGPLLAIQQEKPVTELVKVTADMKKVNAYDKLRIERVNVRHVGARAKRAAEAEKEEKK